MQPNTALVGSLVRWLIPLLFGMFGWKLTEDQFGQVAAGVTTLVLVIGSLYWSQKADQKVVAKEEAKASPPAPPPAS